MIKTTWEYSFDTETLRILHTAHQIAVGFYRANNFLVFPPERKIKIDSQIVLFPDLTYTSIPRFWDNVKKIDIKSTPIKVGSELFEATKVLISESVLPEPKFIRVENLWEKHSQEILEEIFVIIPDKKHVIKHIKIFPTSYGTSASFSYAPTQKGEMFIYLRQDQGIYAITEAILTTLTRKEVYEELSGGWSESELLVDWLTSKTIITNILKKYEPITDFVPTLKATRVMQNAKLLKESDEYYKELGIPTLDKPFSLSHIGPEINNVAIENLTHTEKVILSEFIKKANEIVSADDLANLMFKSEENFSLYAISKQIERLRNKLEENGISGSYIQTLRGQGYLLKN